MIKQDRTFFYFTFPLAILIICVSLFGLFYPDTYFLETPQWHAQCIGQDILDLFLIVPVLIFSGLFCCKDNKVFYPIFGGTVLYIAYTFVIYCFAVHYNFLFLVYCFILGLAVYAFIYFINVVKKKSVEKWYDEKTPVKWTGVYLLIPTIIFYFLWLSKNIPAAVHNTTPDDVLQNGLITNPVHALDIALFLPGLIITSVLLIKKHPLGYLLAPAILVFFILMNTTIAVLALIMNLKGVSQSGFSVVWMMSGFAIASILMLFFFFNHLKKEDQPDEYILTKL